MIKDNWYGILVFGVQRNEMHGVLMTVVVLDINRVVWEAVDAFLMRSPEIGLAEIRIFPRGVRRAHRTASGKEKLVIHSGATFYSDIPIELTGPVIFGICEPLPGQTPFAILLLILIHGRANRRELDQLLQIRQLVIRSMSLEWPRLDFGLLWQPGIVAHGRFLV